MAAKRGKNRSPQIRQRTKPTTGQLVRTPKPGEFLGLTRTPGFFPTRQQPAPHSAPIDIDVELRRYADDDGVSWHATWSETDSPMGIEDSEDDLPTLIKGVLESLPLEYGAGDFRLSWLIDGDDPSDGSIDDAILAAGVTLPDTYPTK